MEIGKITGIPAHPLFVHVPIILIPVVALLTLAYLLVPAWRKGLLYPTGVLAIGMMLFSVLAAGSGEKLEEMLDERENALLEHHTEIGEQLEWIAVLFGLAVLGYLFLDWYRGRTKDGKAPISLPPAIFNLVVPIGIAAAILGGVATVWDVRTGHSGAKSVWSEEDEGSGGTESAPASDDDDDEGEDESSLVQN